MAINLQDLKQYQSIVFLDETNTDLNFSSNLITERLERVLARDMKKYPFNILEENLNLEIISRDSPNLIIINISDKYRVFSKEIIQKYEIYSSLMEYFHNSYFMFIFPQDEFRLHFNNKIDKKYDSRIVKKYQKNAIVNFRLR